MKKQTDAAVQSGGQGERSFGLLSASTLKLLACLFMLIDHAGLRLFPAYRILRIIGRLAFPLFAFFIAEGCRYTRNKKKRFLLVFVLGVICEVVYVIYAGKVEGNVLLTFSCSILLIYALQAVKKHTAVSSVPKCILSIVTFVGLLIVSGVLAVLLDLDYGLTGILLPVFTSLFDYKDGECADGFRHLDRPLVKLLTFSVGLFLLVLDHGITTLQVYCLFAIPLLLLYNGKPGVRRFKYGFYLFYPLHLLLLEAIALLLAFLRG